MARLARSTANAALLSENTAKGRDQLIAGVAYPCSSRLSPTTPAPCDALTPPTSSSTYCQALHGTASRTTLVSTTLSA